MYYLQSVRIVVLPPTSTLELGAYVHSSGLYFKLWLSKKELRIVLGHSRVGYPLLKLGFDCSFVENLYFKMIVLFGVLQ